MKLRLGAAMAKNNWCGELVLLFGTGLRLSQDASGLGLYSAWGGASDRKSGKVPMVLIEVQTGAFLGEDDIIRYEGVWGALSLMLGADALEHGAQINRALVANRVKVGLEPVLGRLAPDIAQPGQKGPFHVHLRGGPHRL